MEISRGTLFDAVWESPRKKLAAEWAISANAITSACRQYDVPLPPPGYWTRVSMDKPTERPSLSGPRDTVIDLIDAAPPDRKRRRQNPTAKQSKQSEPRKQSQDIGEPDLHTSVQTTISAASPAIRKAFRSYASPKAARDFRYQHVLPGSDTIVRIAVMPEMVERALLIMDAILRRMAENKWAVKTPAHNDRTKNSVEIEGVTVFFTITEQRRQERVKSDQRWTDWEYRYHSTGILRFQYGAGPNVQEIKDTKTRRLEERIEDVIQALRDEVRRTKDAETKRRERERLYRLGQMLSEMVRKAVKYNEQCETKLDACVAQHEQAVKIRSLVDDIKRRNAPAQLKPEQVRWIDWALTRANEIDPATNFDELDYAVPETVLSQVQAMIEAEPERYGQLNELELEHSIEKQLDWIKKYPGHTRGN